MHEQQDARISSSHESIHPHILVLLDITMEHELHPLS
jgi:hypothetical protein